MFTILKGNRAVFAFFHSKLVFAYDCVLFLLSYFGKTVINLRFTDSFSTSTIEKCSFELQSCRRRISLLIMLQLLNTATRVDDNIHSEYNTNKNIM